MAEHASHPMFARIAFSGSPMLPSGPASRAVVTWRATRRPRSSARGFGSRRSSASATAPPRSFPPIRMCSAWHVVP